MAQTLTKTISKRLDPNFRLDSAIARGFKCESGSVALESYATGGISMSLSHIDPSNGGIVIVPPQGGYNFSYDHTNDKLQVYVSGGDTNDAQVEVAAGVDLSALTAVPYIAFGW